MSVKRIALLIALLMIMLCASMPVMAAGDIIPPMETNSTVEKIYEKYPIKNYVFDEGKTSMFDISKIFNSFASIIFLVSTLISKLAIYVVVMCFELNIFDMIGSVLDLIINALKQSIFDKFLVAVVVLYALAAFWQGIRSGQAVTFRKMLVLIAVLGICYWFYQSPSTIVNGMNRMSKSISYDILKGVMNATSQIGISGPQGKSVTIYSDSDAAVLLGNLMWEVNVLKPWQTIEFGEEVSNEKMEQFLSLDPSKKDRITLAEEESKKEDTMFSSSGYLWRVVLALLIAIVQLIFNVVCIIAAAPILLNQAGAVMLVGFSMLIFLAALYPRNNPMVVLEKYFLKLGGLIFMKVSTTFMFAMYFTVALVLYSRQSTLGWFITMIAQVVCIVVLIFKKDDIEGFLAGLFQGGGTSIADDRGGSTFNQKITSAAGAIHTAQGIKSAVDGFKQRRNETAEKKFFKKNDKVAEDVLTKRYITEKEKAERKAEQSGRPVKHTDFVKKVENNVKRGLNPYDEEEKTKVLKEMKAIRDKGGDHRVMLAADVEGKTTEEAKQGQKAFENRIYQQRQRLEKRSKQNEAVIKEDILSSRDSSKYHNPLAVGTNIKQGLENAKRKAYDATVGEFVNKVDIPQTHIGKLMDENDAQLLQTQLDPRRELRERQEEERLGRNYSGDDALKFLQELDKTVEYTEFAKKKLKEILTKNPSTGYTLESLNTKIKTQRDARISSTPIKHAADSQVQANDVIKAYRQVTTKVYEPDEAVTYIKSLGKSTMEYTSLAESKLTEAIGSNQVKEVELNNLHAQIRLKQEERIKGIKNIQGDDKKVHANDVLEAYQVVKFTTPKAAATSPAPTQTSQKGNKGVRKGKQPPGSSTGSGQAGTVVPVAVNGSQVIPGANNNPNTPRPN